MKSKSSEETWTIQFLSSWQGGTVISENNTMYFRDNFSYVLIINFNN